MIAHVAVFTFTDEMTPERAEALAVELRAMAAKLPSIHRYSAGPNLQLRDGGADFGVVAVVEDKAALDAFLDSREHVELVSRSMTPFIRSRNAVQIELPATWAGLWSEDES